MKTTTIPAAAGAAALSDMARHIDQLPLLPQVLVRIMQVSSGEDDYFEQVSTLAKEDPPFAVRLLSMANSSSSAPASPIKSIKDALTRIGAGTITSLVASLAVQRVFMPSSPSHVALWRHSVRVAVGAELLAQRFPALKLDKNEAYLAGLLHDIGRFVMFEHAPEALQKVDESHWSSPQELIEADVDIFKFTHSELGYRACAHWGLPDALAQIVRRHHDDMGERIAAGGLEAGILCVEVADLLDVMILENENYDNVEVQELAAAIERHCLYCAASRAYFDAQLLAAQIDKIRADSARLLAGLGLG